MSRLKGAAIGAGCVVVSLAIAATAALAGLAAGQVSERYGAGATAAILLISVLAVGCLVGAFAFDD